MKTLVSSTNSQFLYVSSSYAGSVSNGSITNPYKTIQAAINAAQNGATILLKKGDLFNINHSINLHDKHIHLNNYGSESLPIISGFISVPTNVRRISNTNKWMMNVPASCTNIGFFYYRQTDSIVLIDLIGGCFQTASTRFGNGIEFWIPSIEKLGIM